MTAREYVDAFLCALAMVPVSFAFAYAFFGFSPWPAIVTSAIASIVTMVVILKY